MGLCDAGTAEFRGVAETVPGLFEKSFKRPALCGVGLYDRHFAGEKYGEHSALNMFWEYSMTDPYILRNLPVLQSMR